MNVDDMIILSIDDHTIEPPDMFERHVPAAPRFGLIPGAEVDGLEFGQPKINL